MPGTSASSQSSSTMSQPAGVDGFPVEYRSTWMKVWGFMFGRHVFTEAEYIQYVKKERSPRQLLTWTGVVSVPVNGIENFLEDTYEGKSPLVIKNIKEKQSQVAKKRKADEDEQRAADAAPSSTRVEASSSARPFLEPEVPPTPKSKARPFLDPEPTSSAAASSSGRSEASRSWSYNRDHYSACREWSWWQGAWYYRDEAGGRWILWRR